MLIDTHCHIHSRDYPLQPKEVFRNAVETGVGKYICVGTDIGDSSLAVDFAKKYDNCWASIGLHPHDAQAQVDRLSELDKLLPSDIVIAIGECGLDYFYDRSPRELQAKVLRYQIELAIKHNLPLIFHVREAFDDFWRILDDYRGIRGVLHSFTDTEANAKQAIKRDLYIGVNGIATFTKDLTQQAMFANLPLENIIIETDAPFLTPNPYRGKVNEPKNVQVIAEFLAAQQNLTLAEVAQVTTKNAQQLFKI